MNSTFSSSRAAFFCLLATLAAACGGPASDGPSDAAELRTEDADARAVEVEAGASAPDLAARASSVPSVTLDCPSDRGMLERAAPATYALFFEALTANGEVVPEFFATAFAIGDHLLATNAHVTEGLRDRALAGPYKDIVAVQAGTGAVVPLDLAVTHPGYTGDPHRDPDVGLLTTRVKLPTTLTLGTATGTTSLQVTDDVYVVGFPGDVSKSLGDVPGQTIPQVTALDGDVTALRNFDSSVVVTATTVDVIQHDAATSPGTSGSAMLSCGKVVGVNNAGTVEVIFTPGADGTPELARVAAASNNFGIDVKHLQRLVAGFEAGDLTAFDLNSLPPVAATPPSNAPGPLTPPPAGPQPSVTGGGGVDWLVFSDPTSGTVCDVINGSTFEAVVLLPGRELMVINTFDDSGSTSSSEDVLVDGLTVDVSGAVLVDGEDTGAFVEFVADGSGQPRAWMFFADGSLATFSPESALASATPADFNVVGCNACGSVENPAPQMCQ